MNLLFIYGSEINPQEGGVQRVTYDLGVHFTGLGHSVIYLATAKAEMCIDINSHQYFLPNSQKLDSLENIEFYKNLVRDSRIDIIINQGGIGPKLTKFCIKIKEYFDVKVLSVIHNSLLGNVLNFTSSHSTQIKRIPIPFLFNLLQTKLIAKILTYAYILKYRRHYTYSLNKYDKVVLLSESYYPELKIIVPKCDFSKIASIANPCILKVNKTINNKQNELLYVGRINTAQKRVDLLLDIWGKIYDKFPDWKFSIVGDGPEREELENSSKNMGLKRIKFYGLQNPVSFYERAKILCMTSAYEGFPLVLVEAQNFATIPIAFKSFASIDDIINTGENGLLVDAFNIEKYVAGLSEMMGNDAKMILMAKNCQKSADKFSIEFIGIKWIGLFNDLLGIENNIPLQSKLPL